MLLLKAWEQCPHGGKVVRASTGTTYEKWFSEKPDLPPSLTRFLLKSIMNLTLEDIFAEDWKVGEK